MAAQVEIGVMEGRTQRAEVRRQMSAVFAEPSRAVEIVQVVQIVELVETVS
jgi:hypothetical protein